MRQRVVVAEQAVGKEHRRTRGDPQRPGGREPEFGEVQADLFHGRDRHPVCRVGSGVERPNEVGEGAAARDHEDRAAEGGEDGRESRRTVEERAAELDDERGHGGVL